MANSRYYSSTAQITTLTGGITASDITVPVASTAGFPGSLPFTIALDYGAANMELVEVTNVASLSLTVTRAIDGTSASSHAVGAVVRHVSSARDFTDSRTHEAASTNVHGLSGGAAVVGTTSTQTLTNKTLTRATGTLQNVTVYNTGATGHMTIIGDSTNPTDSRLEIKDNEVSLNTLLFIQSTGNIKSVKAAAEADNVYRFRMTDNDGTTDRVSILAGGTINATPNGTTTFPAVDIVAPDTSTTKRSVRVAASGGGTERFTVWNDGHVDITGTSATTSHFNITAAAGQSNDIARVMDSGANVKFRIESDGRAVMNQSAVIQRPGSASGTILQVGGSNVGYTGALTQWVGPANNVVAEMNELGVLTKYANNTPSTYTPAISGHGTATFTTQTGTYYKIGKLVFFIAHFVVNAVGSGSTNIAITAPSAIDGTSVTHDTVFNTHFQAGSTFTGYAVKFAGSNSSTIDRIRVQDGGATDVVVNLVGSRLTTGAIINVTGWYIEA